MTIEITGPLTLKSGMTQDSKMRPSRTDAADTPQDNAGSASQDKVSLTATAALLHKLDTEVAASPVVDTARVNGVRAAINDGSFSIDPDRVAGKLIRFELAVQARGSGRKT